MRLGILLFVLLSVNAAWAGLGEKFCAEKADAYVHGYHQRVLDEIGVIQGYWEEVDMEYSQKINQMDQRDETYHYYVYAGNDEGDTWTWEYVVEIEAWLAAGGKAHMCSVTSMKFLGVTEEHTN